MARERSKNQESQSQDIEQRHGGQFSRRDWGLPLGPFGMMRWFTDEMDRMFGNFGFPGTERSGRGGRMDRFSPQVDLFERDGQLVIRADLPGMNKDDVKVEITEDALIIDGERKYEHEQNEKGVFRFHNLIFAKTSMQSTICIVIVYMLSGLCSRIFPIFFFNFLWIFSWSMWSISMAHLISVGATRRGERDGANSRSLTRSNVEIQTKQ